MKINKTLLQKAAEKNIIETTQIEPLWDFFSKNNPQPQNNFANILYYLGGFTAIGAITIFLTFNLHEFGGIEVILITLGYATIAYFLMQLFNKKQHFIPAGIACTFLLALVPLLVYGIQLELGMWNDNDHTLQYHSYHRLIKSHWLPIEIATLGAGLILLLKYRYPFLTFIIGATILYMCLDLAALITEHNDWQQDWEQREKISLIIGLISLLATLLLDIKTPKGPAKAYTFWLYLFSTLSFWIPLSLLDSDSELGKFIYFMINLLMILFGGIIRKNIFIILGSIGVIGYLSHLSIEVFDDTIAFSLILSAIGIAIVFCGIWWQKKRNTIANKLDQYLPKNLR